MTRFHRRNYFRGDIMDAYLASLRLFRKAMAKDETSLFRSAAEQVSWLLFAYANFGFEMFPFFRFTIPNACTTNCKSVAWLTSKGMRRNSKTWIKFNRTSEHWHSCTSEWPVAGYGLWPSQTSGHVHATNQWSCKIWRELVLCLC